LVEQIITFWLKKLLGTHLLAKWLAKLLMLELDCLAFFLHLPMPQNQSYKNLWTLIKGVFTWALSSLKIQATGTVVNYYDYKIFR
jgi:hypothetical protein